MHIELTKETEAKLAALAELKEMSPEALATQMLEAQAQKLAMFEREKIDDIKRLESMKNNGGVDHDDMMDWLDDLSAGKDV